jgi:hypothetical protein
MIYLSTKEAAEKWKVSERTIRNYCEQGKIDGVIHAGSTWIVPATAINPNEAKTLRAEAPPFVKKILSQRKKNYHFGIYEYIQSNLAYSSCRIASNRLTLDQVIEIYRTGKISKQFEPIKVDDIIEIKNHFLACGFVLDTVMMPLSSAYIRTLHQKLLRATQRDLDGTLHIGEYRKQPDRYSSLTDTIDLELEKLIDKHENRWNDSLKPLLDFHASFEAIHPFEDGNGRVGRLLLMKECLRHGVEPFIIDDKHRGDYNKGIAEWNENPSLLISVAETAQRRFRDERVACDAGEFLRPTKGRGAR